MASTVWVAFDNNFLDEFPTWTQLSGTTEWASDRGRAYELDRTETGTAHVTLYDTLGTYDGLGTGVGSLANKIVPLLQIQIRATNPIDNSTVVQYTGVIEDWSYEIDKTERLMTTTINCVDSFDVISGIEVDPGPTGLAEYAAQRVDDRIRSVLQDLASQAGYSDWPASWTNIFTGNTVVQGTKYQPGTDLLTPIRDAADAEFPTVANVFIDKMGRVNFRGRLARLEYLNYAASSTPGSGTRGTGNQSTLLWNVGDAGAANSNSAWITDMRWMIDKTKIINACLCTPEGIRDLDVAAQLVTDPTSIAKYGPRSQKIEGLIVRNGIPNSGAGIPYKTANDECLLYAQYVVSNYKTPHPRISALTLSTQPVSSLYAGHWKFLLNVEIDDVLFITTHDPGGGGFVNEGFFVEGIHISVRPGTSGYEIWEMSLDVSPKDWYNFNPFTGEAFMAPAIMMVTTAANSNSSSSQSTPRGSTQAGFIA